MGDNSSSTSTSQDSLGQKASSSAKPQEKAQNSLPASSSKKPQATAPQGPLKVNDAKIESTLRRFDKDRAYGPLIGKTREERVKYGEATGQSVPDGIKEWLKAGKCSAQGRWRFEE